MKYGFLGLGIMGGAMAANLLKAGHELVVWNRHPDKCGPLVDRGAQRAETPADVVAACDVTFAMLSDPAAAESVCLGPTGALEAMGPGKGYVEMSTIDPATSQDLAQAVIEQGGRYLEAPVSGSKKPAEDGALVILAAGDEELYREVASAFALLGKKSVFLGPVGQGSRMKLVVNMIMGGMMVAFAEGLGLAGLCGLETADLLDVLAAGAVACPMLAVKGPQMAAGNFTTSFPLKHMAKDMRLAAELAGELGQGLPCAEAVQDVFADAVAKGLGNEDFSAVYKALRD